MKIISRKEAKSLGLKRYFTGKPCKHGHIVERNTSNGECFSCGKSYRNSNKEEIAKKKKAYTEKNKEEINRKRKLYREENKEEIARKKKAWREANKEAISERSKLYYRANKEKLYENSKRWHKNNPMQSFARGSLQRIEKATGKPRVSKAELELGYTQEEFIAHIESQFKDGMSWNNRSEWHIDHIKPISLFIKDGETRLKVINSLSNLRPLWASENKSKSCKYDK